MGCLLNKTKQTNWELAVKREQWRGCSGVTAVLVVLMVATSNSPTPAHGAWDINISAPCGKHTWPVRSCSDNSASSLHSSQQRAKTCLTFHTAAAPAAAMWGLANCGWLAGWLPAAARPRSHVTSPSTCVSVRCSDHVDWWGADAACHSAALRMEPHGSIWV